MPQNLDVVEVVDRVRLGDGESGRPILPFGKRRMAGEVCTDAISEKSMRKRKTKDAILSFKYLIISIGDIKCLHIVSKSLILKMLILRFEVLLS